MNAKLVLGWFAIILSVVAQPPRLPGQDRPPVQTKLVNPLYPYELSKKGIGGSVIVEFIVDSNGNVPRAQALQSSDRRFEAEAVKAVLQWKFSPGEKNGRKVNVRASQLIEFNLDPVPVYPLSLLLEEAEGTATVEFLVDARGHAVQTRVISASNAELGYAAQAAVEDGTYGPPIGEASRAKTPRQMMLKFAVKGKSDAPVDPWIHRHRDQLRKNVPFPSETALSKPLVRKLYHEPNYPQGISSDIQTGKAVVNFIVDRQGKVHAPRIISSSEAAFGFSAVQAVGTWTYEPLNSEVKGDGMLVEVTLEFKRPS